MSKLELKNFIKLVLFLLLFFAVARMAFVFLYVTEYSLGSLVWALVAGLRFDFAGLGFVLIPSYLLTRFLYIDKLKKSLFATSAFLGFCFVLISTSVVLVISDILYYPHAAKKLGYEAFVYLDSSIVPIATGAFKARPLDFFVFIPVAVGILYLLFKRVQAWIHSISMPFTKTDAVRGSQWLLVAQRFGVSLLVIICLVIANRGGLQRVVLRVGDAFISQDTHYNNAVLNATFVVFRSLKESSAVKVRDPHLALAEVKAVLKIEEAQLIDPDYPILRRNIPSGVTGAEAKKYNVVVVLLESWTAKYLYMGLDEKYEATPNFNKLAQEGVWFPRFFSSGFRTTSGLFSVLNAQPDQVGIPVMRRKEISHNFGSLSRILKDLGYYNLFFHGGKLDFDNLQNMLVLEKFDKIVGEESFPKDPQIRNDWGVFDGAVYSKLIEELKTAPRPFFLYSLTVTTHAPYSLPEGYKGFYGEELGGEQKYLNALRYADEQLGQFIKDVSKEDYFKDTIFVFTGDHTGRSSVSAYENQKVPLLIYAPHILKPQVRQIVASHADIIPTLGELIPFEKHASLGKNLFATADKDGVAYFISGLDIGYADSEYFVLRPPHKASYIVFKHGEKTGEEIPSSQVPDMERLGLWPLSFYQTSADLLFKNKIYK